jgi:restriction system protein
MQEVIDRLSRVFNLTEADLAEALSSGGNRWANWVAWVRFRLVQSGDMYSPAHGVWGITEQGRRRLGIGPPPARPPGVTPQPPVVAPPPDEPPNLEEIADHYFEDFKGKVLQQLHDLTPAQFERFAGILLSAYGFTDVEVTGHPGDGGIDGHGRLKVGLARMNVAFQCKRWQGSVPRAQIDMFRGAIAGRFEMGYFFTTSDFSRDAEEAAVRIAAPPVVLFNGQAIVQLMVDKGLGIRRRPVEVFEDQLETLFREE